MANWFVSVSSGISQSEISENITPYKYWKGFLSVKLRANSNQIHNQTLWSAKDCGVQPTLWLLSASIISLFIISKRFCEHDLQSYSLIFKVNHLPTNIETPEKGQAIPSKGIKPGDCQDKRRKVRSQGILNYIGKRKQKPDERQYRNMWLRNHKWNKLQYVIAGRQQNERATFQVETKPNHSLTLLPQLLLCPSKCSKHRCKEHKWGQSEHQGEQGTQGKHRQGSLEQGICTDMVTNYLQ